MFLTLGFTAFRAQRASTQTMLWPAREQGCWPAAGKIVERAHARSSRGCRARRASHAPAVAGAPRGAGSAVRCPPTARPRRVRSGATSCRLSQISATRGHNSLSC